LRSKREPLRRERESRPTGEERPCRKLDPIDVTAARDAFPVRPERSRRAH